MFIFIIETNRYFSVFPRQFLRRYFPSVQRIRYFHIHRQFLIRSSLIINIRSPGIPYQAAVLSFGVALITFYIFDTLQKTHIRQGIAPFPIFHPAAHNYLIHIAFCIGQHIYRLLFARFAAVGGLRLASQDLFQDFFRLRIPVFCCPYFLHAVRSAFPGIGLIHSASAGNQRNGHCSCQRKAEHFLPLTVLHSHSAIPPIFHTYHPFFLFFLLSHFCFHLFALHLHTFFLPSPLNCYIPACFLFFPQIPFPHNAPPLSFPPLLFTLSRWKVSFS